METGGNGQVGLHVVIHVELEIKLGVVGVRIHLCYTVELAVLVMGHTLRLWMQLEFSYNKMYNNRVSNSWRCFIINLSTVLLSSNSRKTAWLTIFLIVDGNWGQWEHWGSCSKSCEGGNQSRIRHCNDPPMAYGGVSCVGNPSYTEKIHATGIQQQEHVKACNEHICPSK